MKTYSESQGKIPFNWNEALDQKEISEVQWSEMKMLARSWVTCACGNLCDAIPRFKENTVCIPGAPIDDELRLAGIQFHDAIGARLKERAKTILAQIEHRSAEILSSLDT